MASSESEDEGIIYVSVDVEQSLGVDTDPKKAGQSSGSLGLKRSVGHSLDKASVRGPGQSSPQDDRLIQELRRMESSLKSSIEAVSNRVDRLEANCAGPPLKKRATTESRRHWADRDDTVDQSVSPR